MIKLLSKFFFWQLHANDILCPNAISWTKIVFTCKQIWVTTIDDLYV